MNIANVLDQVGLSDGEQKVYLALLELGESTSGPIAEKSGVSASKVYQVIDRLLKKGLVGESLKKGTKHFSPLHPKAILDYLEEQKRLLEETKRAAKDILPKLQAQYDERADDVEVQLSRGMKSLRNTFYGMIDELQKGEEYYVIGGSMGRYSLPKYKDFFRHYHAERGKRGVKAKLLFQHGTPVLEEMGKDAELKFLPPSFQNPVQINVHNETTNLLLMEDEPVIFTIKSREVANSFMQYFEELWNQEVQTLRGEEGVQSVLMDALKEKEICFIGGGGYIPDRLTPWYEKEYKPKAIAAGHKWRNLVLPSMRSHKVLDIPFAESRFLPPGDYPPSVIYIYGNKVANVIWEDEPIVFLVENEKAAKAHMQYFEALWQQEHQTWRGDDAIAYLVDDLLDANQDLHLIGAHGVIYSRYPKQYKRIVKEFDKRKRRRFQLSQETTRDLPFNAGSKVDVTYLPDNFLSPMVIWIYGDVVSQVLWEDEITVFRIKNKKVADDYRTYFDFLKRFATGKPLKSARRSRKRYAGVAKQ